MVTLFLKDANSFGEDFSGNKNLELRQLIEGPPPVTKNLEPLTPTQLEGFRLNPNTGRLSEEMTKELFTTPRRNKNKKKKDKDARRRDKQDKKGRF